MTNIHAYFRNVAHKAISCVLIFNLVFIDAPIFAMEHHEEEVVDGNERTDHEQASEGLVDEKKPANKESLFSLYVTAMAMAELGLLNPQGSFGIESLNPSNQQEALRYKEVLNSGEWTVYRTEVSTGLLNRLLGRDSRVNFQEHDDEFSEDDVELIVLGDPDVAEKLDELEENLHTCKMSKIKARSRSNASCCGVVTIVAVFGVFFVFTIACLLGTLMVCVGKQPGCPPGQGDPYNGYCHFSNHTAVDDMYEERMAPKSDCLPVAVATLGTDFVVGTGTLVVNGLGIAWCFLTRRSANKKYQMSIEEVIEYTDMQHLPQIFTNALANGISI